MLQPKRKAAHIDPARLACAESHLIAGKSKRSPNSQTPFIAVAVTSYLE